MGISKDTYRETLDRHDSELAAFEREICKAKDHLKALESDQKLARDRRSAFVDEFSPKVMVE